MSAKLKIRASLARNLIPNFVIIGVSCKYYYQIRNSSFLVYINHKGPLSVLCTRAMTLFMVIV